MTAYNPTGVEGMEFCGWQFDKSLTECNRYMLDNQLTTDVGFEVGLPDAARGVVRAHKYVLMSRSFFFETMFCGKQTAGLKKDADTTSEMSIQVNDMEANIFKEVVSFIYTDEATVTSNNALPLLQAAKKYLIGGLRTKCQKFLQDHLSPENACSVLDESLTVGETEVKEHCVKWIGDNSDDSMNSEGFLSLSVNALEILIGSDTLDMNESVVHASCIAWAKSQLNLDEIALPTDEQIRQKLGNVLYRIRYPLLSAEKFGRLVGKSGLLTDKEKAAIYYYIAVNEQDENLKFDFKPRFIQHVVDRFADVTVAPWVNYGYQNYSDGIQFTTNKDIALSAIGIFMGDGAGDFDISITVQNVQGVILTNITRRIQSDGNTQKMKVNLDKEIAIQAGTAYTVWTAPMRMPNGGSYGCLGNGGQTTCAVKDVVFTFSAYAQSPYTTVNQGQLPQFYFKRSP